MKIKFKKQLRVGLYIAFGGLAVLIAGGVAAYNNRILPHVLVGTIEVGGLTRQQAEEKLRQHKELFDQQGIILTIQGAQQIIPTDPIDYELDVPQTVTRALRVGRAASLVASVGQWAGSPFQQTYVEPVATFSEIVLADQIQSVAQLVDKPLADVRLQVKGATVQILTDTHTGLVINQPEVLNQSRHALHDLDLAAIEVPLKEDVPSADPASAPEAKVQAERMIKNPIALEYDEGTFTITREQLGTWITTTYDTAGKLIPTISDELLRAQVAKWAGRVNRSAGQPVLKFQDGRVTEFVPPHPGRGLDEEETIALILKELGSRKAGSEQKKKVSLAQDTSTAVIQLPIKLTKAAGDIPKNIEGITELIGKATTPFVGSPENRMSNIKNGVKFLSGVILQPDEEFSTLHTLGAIDNTTGYLPELVIKGDRTLPEFGGGLCQVSTTLFRAVMNAGLPVTRRRNHSYRVSYYERDGLGTYIGPGLDATIYEPDPDFRFKNDTGHAILIYGYVTGTKATFELYGTSDGRKSKIIGPKILTETPAGDAVYEETSLLPKGTQKQVEKPHPGGTATATYEVVYADGKKVSQVFKSSYRPWPARYLVGIGESTPVAKN